ncbi:hypothetical protein NA57DRAFT_50244 [Rhizodiscina lignyota]|uniref:Uncharacterized protein n=1 Tax=Rhizodiscina lignyota TaxID=1504668 RepID=A0A9P4I2S2_9PEZI|nr:hypothetical protein NA57DRAFT_50244 [Rhizodiscina lignyota]
MKFSEREVKVMAAAMQSVEGGPPRIDFKRMAPMLGMTNPGSASNAWAPIRKRLFGNSTPATPSSALKEAGKRRRGTPKSGTSKKGTPASKKRKAMDADDSPKKESPKKRGRKPAVKKEEVKEEVEEREDSGTEGNVSA